MKVINHIRRWNKWRKHNLNGTFYKFLVLIGVKELDYEDMLRV